MNKPFDIPILYIPFRRLNIVKQVLPSILEINPKRLYIFQDGPRDKKESKALEEVVNYIYNTVSEKNIETTFNINKSNFGPYKGVWEAVSWLFENEEQGIIIEEDIYPSLSFFYFCEKLLKFYKNNKNVWAIVGKDVLNLETLEDIYFLRTFLPPWGFATWRDRWRRLDFDLKGLREVDLPNDLDIRYKKAIYGLLNIGINNFGWDIRVDAFIKANNGFVAHYKRNLVKHLGWEDGTHYSTTNKIDEEIYEIEDVDSLQMVDGINHYNWIDNLNIEKWKYFDRYAGLFSDTFKLNLEKILASSDSISIYGAGFLGRIMYFIYDDIFGSKLIYFIDDSSKDNNINNIPILKFEEINNEPDTIIISIANDYLNKSLRDKIARSYKNVKVYDIKEIMDNKIN
ncbi:MAG: hypothetical protein C0172_03255 [Caldisphaera sp.]|nr:MAG: hypothetical protein C0172_03255 [Caldisphaera sp.]